MSLQQPQEEAKVPNVDKDKSYQGRCSVVMSHEDLMEIVAFLEDGYDHEKQEGLKRHGNHIIEFEQRLAIMSWEHWEDMLEQLRKPKRNRERIRELFYRVNLVAWFIMVVLFFIGKL